MIEIKDPTDFLYLKKDFENQNQNDFYKRYEKNKVDF